jgi:hypothetical protein
MDSTGHFEKSSSASAEVPPGQEMPNERMEAGFFMRR